MEVLDKLVSLMPSLVPGVGGHHLDKLGTNARRLRMRNVFAAPIEMAKDFVAPLVPKNEEQIEFLEHALKDNFVFGSMQSKELRTLVNAMTLNSVKKGTKMIQQGDKGDYLYVLQSGTVKFMVDGVEVGEASSSGTVIGELALLYDCPRAATVVATTDCEVWRVSQHVFRRIKAAYALQNDLETRSALRKISFFQDLPQEYVHILADSMFIRNFKQDEVLIRKGDEGETLIIIKEGHLLATDISIGKTKYADSFLGPGDFFGERPIVMGTPNVATVTATTDGKAWFLTKERFLRTLGHLNLDELIRKGQERKILMVIPMFKYSDISPIELDLMASKIEDFEYKKGSAIARMGECVDPAVYIIRSGTIILSDGTHTKRLQEGEYFGFGQETLILTNKLKNQNLNFREDGFAALVTKAGAYMGEKLLKKASGVPALHDAVVTEDARLGRLSLESIASVIYDVSRLVAGQSGSMLNPTITKDALEMRRIIGAGTFGQVWLTRYEITDTAYALKVQFKRELVDSEQANGVIREKNIMARMNHPFIMSIVNAHQDDACVYMVLDLLQGGELRSVMHTAKSPFLSEWRSRFYSAGILEGLSYMHRRSFVYRDLKGENVLLDSDGYCVIVDLGFAKFVPDKTWTFCGTPLFIAPEVVLGKGHDKSADIWSFGVLLYEMLTGKNPFYIDVNMSQTALFKAIVKGKWSFPEDCKLSPSAKDLIRKILVPDPNMRLGCLARADLDLRDHPWFGKHIDWCQLYRKEITAPWVPPVRDPFDGSNFDRWDHPEKDIKDLKPLSEKEQMRFKDF